MINARIEQLRQWMRKKGINAFITPSTDPHCGEYVPRRWQSREWISGFTGSAGTAVVTLEKAALWTDNRYFLQAEEQLKGSEYELMKIGLEGTPSVQEWLKETLQCDDKVGVDGWCYTIDGINELHQALNPWGIQVMPVGDPYDQIWTDRPGIPDNPVEIHPLEYAGETARSKIERIREALKSKRADATVISMLDEVAWTLNLRGTDVDYNPVFVSYLFISQDQAILFVNPQKISEEVVRYLDFEGVETMDYDKIATFINTYQGALIIQPEKTNVSIQNALRQGVLMHGDCPVTTMKIMKNETEIRGYHSAMMKDGIAMVKWMKWVVPAVKAGGQTELSLEKKLLELRGEQPLYRGESFDTIMGYGYHGAIVHYEPTPDTDSPVEAKGLLLIDSGGQYLDGTTDITRTIPLGPLTFEEKRDYTLVLRGFINLGRAVFPRGTYGSQLDVLAREPMWKYGMNYLHGTGHGVGSYLNVHEGPHQFRMNYMPTPLVPGMTITDEPGIYIAGSHGVRHENTMLVVNARLRNYDHHTPPLPHDEGEGKPAEGITFGPYYQFEHLTLCPIFTSPIIREMMQPEEIEWFNAYQQKVCDALCPHLDADTAQWLREITKPI
ncbi:MAG: aminopeptidase P family protein [Bacteroidaceae bacterium]|nr:aminopeptidase P family protein [Bacteroidaceae bacterium]